MRVQTQAASLRAERQSSESQRNPAYSFRIEKPVAKTAKRASQTAFSGNLRAELRAVNEARLSALRGFAQAEKEEEALDANAAILRLRELAKDQPEGGDDATEYLAIQDQIRRLLKSREEANQRREANLEQSLAADYFADEAEYVQAQLRKPAPQSAASMNAVIGEVSEYADYLGAVKKRMETRLDRLAAMTREICVADEAISTDDFAGDVAQFTYAKILGEAGSSKESHQSLAPQVALSLIAV